jgi:hypothetical protein
MCVYLCVSVHVHMYVRVCVYVCVCVCGVCTSSVSIHIKSSHFVKSSHFAYVDAYVLYMRVWVRA